jgi:predicted GIY-YIG superfamily endonuclease
MWYVYLLLCGDDSIYTGITNDLAKRLNAHKLGTGSKYTRSRGAKKILYSEEFKTKSLALKREAVIKKMRRAQKDALLTKASI